jgi:hypothetical protein
MHGTSVLLVGSAAAHSCTLQDSKIEQRKQNGRRTPRTAFMQQKLNHHI